MRDAHQKLYHQSRALVSYNGTTPFPLSSQFLTPFFFSGRRVPIYRDPLTHLFTCLCDPALVYSNPKSLRSHCLSKHSVNNAMDISSTSDLPSHPIQMIPFSDFPPLSPPSFEPMDVIPPFSFSSQPLPSEAMHVLPSESIFLSPTSPIVEATVQVVPFTIFDPSQDMSHMDVSHDHLPPHPFFSPIRPPLLLPPTDHTPIPSDNSDRSELPLTSTPLSLDDSACALLRFGIRVDPLHLVICLECATVVEPQNTRGHLLQNHSPRGKPLHLPTPDVFSDLLRQQGAFETFILPTVPIQRIDGLPLISDGFACTAPHSSVPVFGALRTLQHHFTVEHSSDGYNRRNSSRPALVQAIGQFRSHRQFVEVINTPTRLAISTNRFDIFMNAFKQRTTHQPTPYQIPSNSRERSPFAFTTQWDLPLKDVLLPPLLEAAQPPAENLEPYLYRLGSLIKIYLFDISNSLTELPTLVLRLLKSHEPKYVSFLFSQPPL